MSLVNGMTQKTSRTVCGTSKTLNPKPEYCEVSIKKLEKVDNPVSDVPLSPPFKSSTVLKMKEKEVPVKRNNGSTCHGLKSFRTASIQSKREQRL